jgi:hypothetical protein
MMAKHENAGLTDEWYTPKYVFDAMNVAFDLDVAAPLDLKFITTPAEGFINSESLIRKWEGFCWMNPPFGGRNGIVPWLNKMVLHGNGVALTPDRTSTDWRQDCALKSDAILQVRGKIKFIDQFGVEGKSPSTGTTLFGFGEKGVRALKNAQQNNLGILLKQY